MLIVGWDVDVIHVGQGSVVVAVVVLLPTVRAITMGEEEILGEHCYS